MTSMQQPGGYLIPPLLPILANLLFIAMERVTPIQLLVVLFMDTICSHTMWTQKVELIFLSISKFMSQL